MSKAAEKGREWAEKAWAWIQDKWADFRETPIYFQAKVALFVGYGVIVVGTVVLAPPSPPACSIEVGAMEWGAGTRAFIDITNSNLGDLENAMLFVEGSVRDIDGSQKSGRWKTIFKTFPEKERKKIWPEQLTDKDKRPASSTLQVTRVTLESEDGDLLFLYEKGAAN